MPSFELRSGRISGMAEDCDACASDRFRATVVVLGRNRPYDWNEVMFENIWFSVKDNAGKIYWMVFCIALIVFIFSV